MRDLPFYVLAICLGIAAGLLEVRFEDLLATALFVMIGTMVLGYLRPRWPWRWTVIVGACIPLVRWWAGGASRRHRSDGEDPGAVVAGVGRSRGIRAGAAEYRGECP